MDKVTAITLQDKYKTTIRSEKHEILADEPTELGGTDLGFNPAELLCGSLASCTTITLRMYSDRKEWNISEIIVDVAYHKEDKEQPFISRDIKVVGYLDEKQLSRILSIANACPMHKLLEKGIIIKTTLNN